jgi:predicted 3-demethylubiquinone-9 3-methyltransferase (glyoxalase superfamily)
MPTANDQEPTMKGRITPCLWFDRDAEDAAKFYTSIFPNSRIGSISRYGDGAPLPKGTVLTVGFELDGLEYLALNGGPMFKFTEAISLVVNCASQHEVDHYWDALCAGGQPVQCGWLKDRYGLSWQVVPARFVELMRTGEPAGVARMLQAMMGMVKLDVGALESAYGGPSGVAA